MEHTTQQKENTMATDNITRPTTREPQTTKANPMDDVRKQNNPPEREIQRPQNATTAPAKQQPETMEKNTQTNPQNGNPGRADQNPGNNRSENDDKDQRGSNR